MTDYSQRQGPLVPWINTDPPGIYVDIDVHATGPNSRSTAGGVYLTIEQARALALKLIELVRVPDGRGREA